MAMEMRFQSMNMDLPDTLDRAKNETVEHLNISRYNQNLVRIRGIRNAIERIKYEDYGLCELCGKSIGVERLLAMPDTNFCIQCKMEYVDNA